MTRFTESGVEEAAHPILFRKVFSGRREVIPPPRTMLRRCRKDYLRLGIG